MNEHSKKWGHVRASPTGSCLTTRPSDDWHQWRKDHLGPLQFPVDGFGHIYGQDVIQQVDSRPLGNRKNKLVGELLEGEEEKKDGRDYGSTKTTGKYQQNKQTNE